MAEYKLKKSFKNVGFRVPVIYNLIFEGEQKYNGTHIKPHWKGDLRFKSASKQNRKIIVNINFYNVGYKDCGRILNFHVEILEKTTETGRKFTMLNFHKNSGQPSFHIWFNAEGKGEKILNTNYNIFFSVNRKETVLAA